MLKKTIMYQDYNGETRKEDFYFNLNQAEITELQLTTTGGLVELLEKLMQTKDIPTLYKFFKELVLKSYGEKSLDGKRFNKVDEDGRPLSRCFEQTDAYSELMMELMANKDDAVEKFMVGVMPAKFAEAISNPEIQKQIEEKKAEILGL